MSTFTCLANYSFNQGRLPALTRLTLVKLTLGNPNPNPLAGSPPLDLLVAVLAKNVGLSFNFLLIEQTWHKTMLQRGLVEPGNVTSRRVLPPCALQFNMLRECTVNIRSWENLRQPASGLWVLNKNCCMAKQYNKFCKLKIIKVFTCGSQVLHYIKLIINITQVT